jgi:hypothetical protein
MAIWQIILYVAATFLAVRSLASLLSGHRKKHARKLLACEQDRLQHDAAEPKPADLRAAGFKQKRNRRAA